MIKVKRKTKRELIRNRYSGGSWHENVTTIYYSFLGFNGKLFTNTLFLIEENYVQRLLIFSINHFKQ